ncbi:unnamed protein product [Pleuronectes platessa]|uniref:Uncharacterized protein n=1 Tax=Pleuronectes platessa TaxID=8262 RepID=A0A9N7TJ74_PLEPL|nr:unnamed protein product [Pleuronectes platessa]
MLFSCAWGDPEVFPGLMGSVLGSPPFLFPPLVVDLNTTIPALITDMWIDFSQRDRVKSQSTKQPGHTSHDPDNMDQTGRFLTGPPTLGQPLQKGKTKPPTSHLPPPRLPQEPLGATGSLWEPLGMGYEACVPPHYRRRAPPEVDVMVRTIKRRRPPPTCPVMDEHVEV